MNNPEETMSDDYSPGRQYFVDRQHMNMAYGGKADTRNWSDLSDEEQERYETLAENAEGYE